MPLSSLFARTVLSEPVWALGLMSGTSFDGVDAALICTDGAYIHTCAGSLTMPYPGVLRERIAAAVRGQGDLLALEQELTDAHADAVHALLAQERMPASQVSLIGFHGQTVSHRPAEGITRQLGDPSRLAEKTGISTVSDFRRRDMAAGGVGAPLASLFHAALIRNALSGETNPNILPAAILNIGGIANVTFLRNRAEHTRAPGAGEVHEIFDIISFDTGPGNALIDDWMHYHTGHAMDENGKTASSGQTDEGVLCSLLKHPYFTRPAPKALDRQDFSWESAAHLSLEDGARTLTQFTVDAVAAGCDLLPELPMNWFICGGGASNPFLMERLAEKLGSVRRVDEALGWNTNALEAQAFAFLAVRSALGLPLSLPGTTGCASPVTGGVLTRAA